MLLWTISWLQVVLNKGLDFAARIFINPGDVIICESPSYLGAINAFKAYEPKFVEVETDDEGMIMEI